MVGDLSRATPVATTRITSVGVAASLADLPRGRVVDLIGTDLHGFEVATDPLPENAPAAVTLVVESAASVAHIVDEVVAALADAVVDLFPAWLPGGDQLGESEQLDVGAIAALARRLAAGGGHSVAAVTTLARAGAVDRRIGGQVPPETLVRECARLLADTYRRDHVCLAVSRGPARPTDASVPWALAEQQAVAAACEWVAQHADVAVCLVGDPLPDVDRFTPVRWLGPVVDDGPATDVDRRVATADPGVVVRLPALAGQPHPNSAAEQRLHEYLARLEWAADARWNMTFAPDPLQPPIRVDIAWTGPRCVVEIDGDDHRAPAKYAADRKRDNILQLAGFTVLRFTNDEVLTDVSTVAATIERCLNNRRTDLSATPSQSNRRAHHR